jgi:type II secretory pathway predicted ATPase ExeA
MNTAGCRRDVFSDDALLIMSKASGGIMRRLDVLGDQCLIAAVKARSNIVDAAIVQKAIQACGEALV